MICWGVIWCQWLKYQTAEVMLKKCFLVTETYEY